MPAGAVGFPVVTLMPAAEATRRVLCTAVLYGSHWVMSGPFSVSTADKRRDGQAINPATNT